MSLLASRTVSNTTTAKTAPAAPVPTQATVNLDEQGTVFLSKTLFRVPLSTTTTTTTTTTSNANATTVGSSDAVVSRQCPSYPLSTTLMAFPLGGHHLFVTCGSHTSSKDGVSTVFVVRLSAEGEPMAVRSALAVAAITGCVQDRSLHICGREERMTAPLTTRGKEDGNSTIAVEEGGSVGRVCEEEKEKRGDGKRLGSASPTSSLKSSSVVESSTAFVLGKEEVSGSIDKNGKQAGMNAMSAKSNRISSPHIHLFLIADAVMHAIWAVEVDTELLTARVVSPHFYWSLWEKCHHLSGVEIPQPSRPQVWDQEGTDTCLDSVLRPMALLGGMKGFVDGSFHVARFAAPSALCWRIDEHDISDDKSSGQNDGKQNMSLSTVLFVSDTGNHAIRYVNFRTKLVRTVCGIHGVPGYRDGDYRVSKLHAAAALTWCSAGLLFVDTLNNAIRLLTGVEKTKREGLPQENFSHNTPAVVLKATQAHETSRSQRRVLRVWTVADGLHRGNNNIHKKNKKSNSSHLKEVCWTSLGVPSAMAVMPDGSGVLFADWSKDTLCLLSACGVETFIGPRDYTDPSLMPGGLIACSHILACSLVSPGTTPHKAFLVSSGVRQTVSLLVSSSDVRSGKGEACHLVDNTATGTTLSLFPVDTVTIEDGVLHKYTHGEKKMTVHDTVVHGTTASHRKRYESAPAALVAVGITNGINTPLAVVAETPLYAPTQHAPFLPVSGVTTPGARIGGRLGKTIQRLFDVYAYYAGKDGSAQRCMNRKSVKGNNWLNNTDTGYSLSLVGFWRFFTHAEYCTICTPSLSSPCGEPVVDSTFTVSEDGDRVRWGIQDWRTVVEVLHQSSVEQHGYHVISTMNFTFFCRVILLLQCCLERQKESEEEAGKRKCEGKKGEARGGPNSLPLVSIDTLSEDEIINAYEDALRRVKAVNINVPLPKGAPTTMSTSTKEEEEQEERKQLSPLPWRVGFLAADEVLRVLLRNEKPFRQLFHAYSKKTLIYDRDCCHSSSPSLFPHHTGEGRMTTLQQMRQVLTTGKVGKPSKKEEWVCVMSYKRFHALFLTVDVFPTLLSESLLRRAFVDALVVPLFYRLNRERNATMPQGDDTSLFSFPLSHDVEKKYSSCDTALPFIPFLEAFTRVALTTFSFCGERDRQMYPTSAAKVEALMCWINRSFELGHTHKYGVTASCGGWCGNARGGGRGSQHHNSNGADGGFSKMLYVTCPCPSSVPFPMDFVLFNVTPSTVGEAPPTCDSGTCHVMRRTAINEKQTRKG